MDQLEASYVTEKCLYYSTWFDIPFDCQKGNKKILFCREHIQSNIDNLLLKHPDAMVLLTGDFNPTSTGLDHKSTCIPNNLKQLVSFKTRDTGILDWYCTNRSQLYELKRLPKLASSDHYTVLACPNTPSPKQDSLCKVKIRQSRASNWRDFGTWITARDWSELFSTCAQKYHIISQELDSVMDIYFPWKSVKKHSNDKPWITNNKRSISKRQSAFIKH